MENANGVDETKPDRLLDFLSTESPAALSHVRESLENDGYCILKSILSSDECDRAIDSIWTFVEDSSNAQVLRLDPSSWYPSSADQEYDPFPCTSHTPFPDTFQTNGAGWVHGKVREMLAERVFEPLYQMKKLHSSKEGFTFQRPMASENVKLPPGWLQSIQEKTKFYDDQDCFSDGFQTLRSLVALEDQVEGVDGCFVCWPKSHGPAHRDLTQALYRGKSSDDPLSDAAISRVLDGFGIRPKNLYLNKGDMILFRSDLCHSSLPPSKRTPRFRAVVYTSMQPISFTSKEVYLQKINAYKQRRTGDYRPDVESWHVNDQQNIKPIHRCSFRTSPAIVTKRLAELYGLVQYSKEDDEWLKQKESAVIRGVRFEVTKDTDQEQVPTQPPLHPCHATLEYISTELSMVGQDKYLGGMPSPCGDYVYGVPGSAKRVLRINVKTKVMDMVGPSFEGKFKWLRGVDVPPDVMNLADFPRGCCLALPSNATSVLKINPETQDITTFGQDVLGSGEVGETGWFYHGGNVAANNGMIYAIPANATHVLKICPRTDQVWKIGPSFGPGRQKWFGGIVGSDGCIYGIPHNGSGFLKIDPIRDECTVLQQENDGHTPISSGQWKWHGGLAAGDKIYGFPNNADKVLVINVQTQRVYTVGDSSILQSGRHRVPQDGRYKYLGGALSLDEKSVYLFPCDAERVLKIDVETDELRLIGPLLLDGENKYQNGFVSEKDGCLYGIPQRALGILRIDPSADDHVDVMPCSEDMIGIKDKFEGGVMGNDGCIYCIPLRAKTCVKVVPGTKS
jgi:hypothetical protein